MFRCWSVAIVAALVMCSRSSATINIWLSTIGTVTPGSAFPATAGAVPQLQPFLGGAGTVYIWGRPDAGESLINLSLNLVAETQPVCSPACSVPDAIEFTSATIFNQPFGSPLSTRFEYVDDSSSIPPLPIEAERIEGMDGFRIFEGGAVPAVGIGSTTDPLYNTAHNSWLIAEVTYNVLATGENSETRLFLEIGAIGLSHAGETTAESYVIFGDASDLTLNGEADRDIHLGNYDARITPVVLPGDADRNGVVAPPDYTIWRGNFQSTTQLAADHNGNGIVDAADYVIWRNNLGQSAGFAAATVTPEPAACALFTVALIMFWTFFRPTLQRQAS